MKIDQIFDPILEHHDRSIPEDSGPYLAFTPIQRLKEYKTVRIGIGRQQGHSFYISRNAGPKDLIICHSELEAEMMSLRCKVYNVNGCSEIYTCGRISHIPDKGFRNIWVDDASYVSEVFLTDLYQRFAGKCRRVILVH